MIQECLLTKKINFKKAIKKLLGQMTGNYRLTFQCLSVSLLHKTIRNFYPYTNQAIQK